MTSIYEKLFGQKQEEISNLRIELSNVRELLKLKDEELSETKTQLMIARAPQGSDVGDFAVDDAFERRSQ